MSNPVVGSARVVIVPDSTAFASQLTAQLGALQGPATAAGNRLSQAFAGAAATLGNVGAQLTAVGGSLTKTFTLPIGLATAGVVKFGTEFDTAIRTAATIGGIDVSIIGKDIEGMGEASAQAKAEVDVLKQAALDLGTQGKLGPVEVAEGFTELARAGILGTDVIKAAAPIINLATAEGIKFSEASEKAINVFAGYGGQLQNNSQLAEQLTHTIDVLAATSNMSTTSMGELTDAFRFVGPVASGMGIQFEETAAALGILANAGFKGTLGGTALRGVLTRLAIASGESAERLNELGLASEDAMEELTKNELDNVEKQLRGLGLRGEELKKAMEQGAGGTQAAQQAINKLGVSVFGADGKMLPLTETLKILEANGATTADVMAIFGQRAGPGLAALLQRGGDELAAWTGQLEDSTGAAKKLAEGIMSGPEGSFARLKNTLEALAIAVSESGVLTGFGEIAEKLTKIVDALRKVDPSILKFVSTFALVVAAIGPVISILGFLTKGLGQLFSVFGFLAAHPLIAALIAIGGALYLAWQNSEDFRKAVAKLGEVFGRILEPILGFGETVKEGFGSGVSVLGELGKAIGDFLAGPVTAFADWLDNAITQLGHLWDVFAQGDDVAQGVGEIIDNIFGNTGALVAPVRTLTDAIQTLISGVQDLFAGDWSGFTEKAATALSQIGSVLGPALVAGIQGALDFAASALGGTPFEGVATSIAEGFPDALGSIGEFVSGAVDALSKLPEFFQSVGEAAETWLMPALREIAAAGGPILAALGDVITTDLIPAFQDLWPIIQNVAEIVGKVFAIAVVAVTNAVAGLLENGGLDFITNSIRFLGDAIREVVGIVRGFTDVIAGLLSGDMEQVKAGLLTLAENILGLFTTIIADIPKTITDFLGGIGDLLLAPLEGIPIFGEAFETLRQVLGDVTNIAGGVFDILGSIFSLDPGRMAEGISKVASGILGIMGEALTALPEILGDILSDGIGLITGGLAGIGEWIANNLSEIPVLGEAFETIGQIVNDVADGVGDIFNIIGGLLRLDFAQVGEGFKNLGVSLLGILREAFTALFEIIPQLLGDLVPLIGQGFALIGDFIANAFDDIPIVGELFDFIGNVINNVGEALSGVWDILGGIFSLDFGQVIDGFKQLGSAVLNLIGGALGNIGQLLGDLGSLLLEALGAIFSSLWDWITTTGLPMLGDALGQLPGALLSLGGFLISAAWTALQAFGSWFASTALPAIVGFLGNLGELIGGWFSSAWQWLVDNGPAILSTVWTFLTAVPGQVIGALGSLGEKLGEWFSLGWTWLGDNWPTLVLAAAKWLSEVKDKILGFLGSLGETLGGWFQAGWDWVKDHWTDILKGLLIAVVAVPGLIIVALGKIGSKLLEWLGDGFNYVKDNAGTIIGGLLSFFNPTNPDGLFGKIAGAIGNVASVLGPIIIDRIKGTFQWVKDELPEIIGGIISFFNPLSEDGLFAKIGGALVGLATTFGPKIKDGFLAVFTWVKDNLGSVIGGIVSFFNPFSEDGLFAKIAGAMSGVAESFGAIIKDRLIGTFQWVRDELPEIAGGVISFFNPLSEDGLFAKIGGALVGAGSALWDGIKAAFTFVKDNIVPWIASVAEFFNPFNSEGLVQKAIGFFANAGSTIWNGIVSAFTFVKDNIGGWIGSAAEFFNPFNPDGIVQKAISFFSTAGSTLWNGIVSAFNFVKDKIGEWIGDAASFFNPFNPDGLLQRIIRGAANLGSDLWNNVFVPAKDWLVQKIPEFISAIVDFFKEIPGKIVDAISGLGSIAADFGKKIANGIIDFVNTSVIGRINDFSIEIAGQRVDFPDIPLIPRLGLGGIFDRATPAIIGEDGEEVVIPLTKTARALELAEKSGLASMIVGALADGRIAPGPAGFTTAAALGATGAPGAPASSGSSQVLLQPNFTTPAAAAVAASTGDTFIINGVSPEQVIAKIQAERDAAARRIRR